MRIVIPIVLVAGILAAGCGGRDKLTRPDAQTPTERVARGWTSFEAGNFTSALSDFTAAVSDSAEYGEAYVGQGWAALNVGTTNDLAVSKAAFDQALQRLTAGTSLVNDARAGRAAALLAQGGANLSAAIQDAAAVRQANAAYQFTHRSSFGSHDLFLIEAFANAGLGQMSAAVGAADQVSASGIVEGNSGTWTVDGVTYPSFPTAVMAHLHKVSNSHAG